jgi:hypothetical protein
MPRADEITEFIRATFRSVWALELLCLLRRHEGSSVAHDVMVSELRGSDAVVTQSLAALTAAGLVIVEADGAARYAPASRDLDRLAGETDDAYRRGPDAVRRLIVNAATPGIAAFADAFRLRKDQKDG